MANEARVRLDLSIRKLADNGVPLIDYRAPAWSFVADVDGSAGPSPGSILVSTFGTDIDLSQLSSPGLCVMINQDANNFVQVGLREIATGYFRPFIKLLPGEGALFRLADTLGEEYPTTGTGTSGVLDALHAKADTADVYLLVNAFEE